MPSMSFCRRSESAANTLFVSSLFVLLLTLSFSSLGVTYSRVSGTVMSHGTPLSALVLANGQHMFSQSDGRFDLNVPLDGNGMITLFTFASGFSPFKETLTPAQAVEYTAQMHQPQGEPVPDVSFQLGVSDKPGWAKISGSFDVGGEPVCGLVLANGQHMFTCPPNPVGQYSLEVPLNSAGNITAFAFADGLTPVTRTLGTTFSFSGTITAAAGSSADGDVNDPASPYVANDSFASAQTIPNPISLGGYVNQARRGASGRSYLQGDLNDYFRVDLTGGQTIRLQIGDITRSDLDLFLLDADGNVVDSSEGTGELETLTAPQTGTYTLRVFAWSGASNYVLTIGQSLTEADLETLRAQNDFVPGELLVKYKQEEARSLGADDFEQYLDGFGLKPVAGTPAQTALAALDDFVPPAAADANGTQTWSVAAAKAETLRTIKRLRADSRIAYAEPNYYRRPLQVPNDALYADQWHYPLIGLPQAWDISTGGANVVVAVVDTGVLLNHPDLQGKLTSGYDFIRDTTNAGDSNGLDSDPDDPGDGGRGGSSSFHGTHVAGTIAAASNNGTGVAGVSWGAKIMPVRVLGVEGGTSYDVMQGVRYAAGLSNDSGTLPAKRADIINLSLGGSVSSQSEQDLFSQVRNQGVIVVAAAGNSNTSRTFYPAGYDGVISVSAVTINKTRAPYSNYGPTVDIAAPGGDSSRDVNGDGYPDGILSTRGDDSHGSIRYIYDLLQGTSMATPHVAGVLALMKGVNPGLSPSQVDGLISSGQITDDIGSSGRDNEFGWGLINAYRAVIAAGGTGSSEPILIASPASLNFGTAVTEQTFSLENGSGGELTLQAPVESASWLSVSAVSTDPDGLGTYAATVSREGLSSGIYSAKITATSSANTIEIPVIMQIVDLDTGANAGRQYVLLIDSETGDTIPGGQSAVDAADGVYVFSFSDIPLGRYELFTGSDHNNDIVICDAAESCGAYPTLDKPELLEVTNTMQSPNFVVSFSAPLNAQSVGGGSSGSRRTLRRLPQ